MARSFVAPLVLIALVASSGPALLGCEAHAQFGSAASAPPPPPPTPAASASPPPATVPAPAASPPPVATALPTSPEPPRATVTMKDGRLSLPGNIVYETGKAVIKPESEPTLSALRDYMDQNKNFSRIRIEGHTDNVGQSADNMKLSRDRASAVVTWLSGHGINKDRCLAVGFGDTRPIADNKTEDGRAQNRRTEFHIAEIDGKPFLGRDETAGGQMSDGQTPPPPPKPRK